MSENEMNLPWSVADRAGPGDTTRILDASGENVADTWTSNIGSDEEIGSFIVKAVNAHADLVALAEMAMRPERDSCDGYSDWHERLGAAASAAPKNARPQ